MMNDMSKCLQDKIDEFLTQIMHQTIIDTSTVIDFALDLRRILDQDETLVTQ